MSQIDQFLDGLKKLLKKKNIVYRELAQKLDISESSVKRILSSKSLTLTRLEEICRLCDIKFSEIIEQTLFFEEQENAFYSEDQEKAFAHNPRLFHLQLLLEEGLNFQKIEKNYEISSTELQKLLLQLDRLGLIELHPKNRIKLTSLRDRRFRKEGAMGKLLFEQTKINFLQADFKQPNEHVRFQMGNMSLQTLNKVKNRIDKCLEEIREEMEFEDQENPELESYGMLFAMRPWRYTWMDSIKKRKR